MSHLQKCFIFRRTPDLINKMAGPTSNGIGETPVSAVSTLTSQRDEDVEDDDGAFEEDD